MQDALAVAATAANFDAKELRRVLGAFVTGVTVVTTIDETGRAWGLTANSFSSVSLEPPLVLWSQSRRSPSHAAFAASACFAVNILAEDQIALSNRFATSGIDKFSGVETDPGMDGLPLLRGCSAWLECKVVSQMPGGDHTIFVGEVRAVRRSERRSLVFGSGQYLVADAHDLGRPPPGLGTTVQSQLHAARIGARAMSRLAEQFDETVALAVWGNHGPTITAWQPSSTPVSRSLPLGLALRVTSTATGLALAANLPPQATRRFIDAELAANASGETVGPANEAALSELLAQVRARGLAFRAPGVFYGSDRMVNAISAPVLDASGHAVIALTAIGDAERFDGLADNPLSSALRAAAEDLSERLGHRGDAPRTEPVVNAPL
ncbi:flavin reductase [Bosea caraganae]|uniref:Flavin reductase n=1 Tax=Bosea caraganae TaxID=2763117 RepID=A0A370KZA8_9HYPH|nr:flavin reductase [Bosea caraganae]RDJ20307.1 flavin reductase [Bosea caraganae]RDJ24003.1 flavin reductase [Bosea caraganae]